MLAYLRLLIKDRLLSFLPSSMIRPGKSKAKGVWAFLGIGLSMLMLYAMAVALEYYVFQAFVFLRQPSGALAVVFLGTVFVTLFVSFFMVFSTLFFSKDVQMVSALPISSRGLLLTKLMMILLSEAAIALLVCLPMVTLYGIHTGAGIGLYVKALLLIPFLPVLPIALVTLLSFVLIRISALWKRREGLTTIFVLLFVMATMLVQMNFSMGMNRHEGDFLQIMVQLVSSQSALLNLMVGAFPPVGWLSQALLQAGLPGIGIGLGFVAASVAAVALLALLVGNSYQPLALRQSEVVARLNAKTKKGRNGWRQRTPLAALFWQEIRELITVPAYATNCLVQLVMFPIMVVVSVMSMGQHMDGLPGVKELVHTLPTFPVFLVMTLIFCFTCFMNMAASTSVSREGQRRYVSRIIPVPASTQLYAKLAMGMTVNTATMLLTAIALCVFIPGRWLQVLGGFAAALPFSLLSCALALILDVYFPFLSWKTETEAVKRNMNGVYSMFGTLGLTGALVAAYFGLLALGLSGIGSILLIVLAMVVIDVLLLKWLNGKASRAYLMKEKLA